jgi:hypothetical protein
LDEPALNSSHDRTSPVHAQQWPPPLAGGGETLLVTPDPQSLADLNNSVAISTDH